MSSPCPPKGVMFTTKDLLTWKGWSLLNDREVVRLSAELGTHITLAQTFIAARRGWEKDEVERWYKAEVTAWVIQLLATGEITIAIQILDNIQIDAVTQLLAIAKEAKHRETIDTISRYLNVCVESEIGEIQENIKDFLTHYCLLRALELALSNREEFDISIYETTVPTIETFTLKRCKEYTVQDIQKCSKAWKSSIAAYLYFQTLDTSIVLFLDANISWDYLLSYNKIEYLKIWIQVSFGKDANLSDGRESATTLHNIFYEWVISESMFARISTSNCMELTKQELFDYLATFGYFNEFERKDVVQFLNRVSRIESIGQIDLLLGKSSANVTLHKFYDMLICYCEKHKIKTVVTKCINKKLFTKDFIYNICQYENNHWLEVARTFLKMIGDPNDEKIILDCINVTTNHFSRENVENYLGENPAVFIAMILFHNENMLLSSLTDSSDVTINNMTVRRNTILNILEKLPHLQFFLRNAHEIKGFYANPDVTLEDMLSKYDEVNISSLFNSHKAENSNLNFDDQQLIAQFGYRAEIPFKYYLEIGSPSFAVKAFYLDKLKQNKNMTEEDLNDMFNIAYNLALKHWQNIEIGAACISAIEILGMNSEKLKCYLSAISYIKSYLCDTTASISKEYIQTIDNNIRNIDYDIKAAENVLVILENSIMKSLQELNTDNLMQWRTPIALAHMHNFNLPESILIFCAQNNQWLWFAIFAQMYNYSQNQVLQIINNFSNNAIREHLIGAWKNHLNCNQDLNRFLQDEIVISDFWCMILRAQSTSHSCDRLLKICKLQGSPVFAALAICYKPDYLIYCWYAWLSSAARFEEYSSINEAYSNISIDNIFEIMDYCIKEGFISTLHESFLIFFPANHFTIFTKFLLHTVAEHNFGNHITELLISFKNSAITLHIMPHLNVENVFKDRTWVLNKAIKLCCTVISYVFKSHFHNKQFLKCLCDAKLTKNIETNVSFVHMLDLLECITNTTAKLNISLISLENNPDVKEAEYESCLKQLIDRKYFEKSLTFAKIAKMNTDFVIISQMRNRCMKLLDEGSMDINIWLDCDKKFHETEISHIAAIEFFLDYADNLEEPKFKYLLYYLALIWERGTETSLNDIDVIEKKMWMNYLLIENSEDLNLFHSKTFDITNKLNPLQYTIRELKMKARIDDLTVSEQQLTEVMTSNLNKLISTLLDLGDFVTAIRVQVMFAFLHSELQLLITIMALAEGSLSPYQMTPAQRMVLMQSKCVRTASGQFGKRTLKSKLSTSSSMSHSPNSSFMSAVFSDYVEIPSREKQDTLCTIEALAARLKAGRFAGERIVMCYRAAMHMDREYIDIIRIVNTSQLLNEAVSSDCMNKLVVVSDLISASGVTSIQIAEYLAYEIFKSVVLGANPKRRKDKTNLNVTLLWGYNLSMDFHLFLELCPEPSYIGIYLLNYLSFIQQTSKISIERNPNSDKTAIARNVQSNISKILKGSKKLTATEINAISVELLICAHDSYTRDCNIEGISLILRRAQMLCLQLLQTRCWGLMVKLLTGVARYAEMTYVFEILKSNDQFEYLLSQFNYILGQQDSKKNQLKMALLEFLKTYWPQDAELKRLVALHFQMHSEVAELLRIEASEIIKRMINIAMLEMTNHGLTIKDMSPEKSHSASPAFVLLSNCLDTKECLSRAMNSYSHSAEYYVQQNKLSLAMKSAHEAELVALQIDLLNNAPACAKIPSVKCILQLKSEQVSYMINKELNFLQSMILQRSYDHTVDWVSALYEHCVINRDMQYLQHYNKHLELNENMAQELAMRFQKETQITKSMIESMRNVISCVHTIGDRYRLASLLGQRDIVENILSSESVCYLKDTIFIGKNS